jgi:hypothetical protein
MGAFTEWKLTRFKHWGTGVHHWDQGKREYKLSAINNVIFDRETKEWKLKRASTFFTFKNFNLLAYCSCAEVHCEIYESACSISVRFTPSIFLLYCLSPFSKVLIFPFWYMDIIVPIILTLLHPFLMTSPHLLVPTPGQGLFYFLVFQFFKAIFV